MTFSPVLALHICGGLVGLSSGALAMIFRKGSRWHGFAGDVFVVSMLTLAATGAYIGFTRSESTNVIMGVLTFYLVTTGWATARRRGETIFTGSKGRRNTVIFDGAALGLALFFGIGLITFGIEAVKSSTGLKDGYPPALYFPFGIIALLAALGDIRMMARGIAGPHRIARHLWRMCMALFIASASFFLGQQRVFPASWRGSPAFYGPPLLSLILLIFWLVRVLLTKGYQQLATQSLVQHQFGRATRFRAEPAEKALR